MKQKNLILMVVAVGCGLVAAFLTTQINAKPKVDLVEVIVAAKDIPVGTRLTKDQIPLLVKRKQVPRDTLPPKFVADENELLDKRLARDVQAESTFDPDKLSARGVIILPDGKDMISLPISPNQAAAGFIGPGSKIDVLATLQTGTALNAFPLLVDMLVLTVDTHTTNDSKGGAFPTMSMVSLAVTQDQALILQLAKKRGCSLELLLRHPNKPVDPKYNLAQVKKMLLEEKKGGVHASEVESPESAPPQATVPPVPTDLLPKQEKVKVVVATANIPANTEVTKDLIAQSFTFKEVAKETVDAVQPYADLTPLLGQVFKTNIEKEQMVFKGMIGPPTSKPAPLDQYPEVKPAPPEPKPARRIHDLAAHTANGTLIHRFEEVAPGEWRLLKTMTPEEALREDKKGKLPSGEPEKSPETTPESGNKKVD